jgi:hypothetical protein
VLCSSALARLRVEGRGVARFRELAEKIHLVTQVRTDGATVARCAEGAVRESIHARDTRTRRELRRAIGVRYPRDGARLRKPRGRHLDAVVAAIGVLDELVQLRVRERLPQFAEERAGGGGCHDPFRVGVLEGARAPREAATRRLRHRCAAGDHEGGDQG